jgi:hypothetical protein
MTQIVDLENSRRVDPRFSHPTEDKKAEFEAVFKIDFNRFYSPLIGFNLFLFSFELNLPTGYPETVFELNSKYGSGASDLLEYMMQFPRLKPLK